MDKNKKREFINRVKILEFIGISGYIILLNETLSQRTYLVKSDHEFFIINDNLGDVKIALRRSNELLKFKTYETNSNILLKLEGITPEIKVSKIIFPSISELNKKISEL